MNTRTKIAVIGALSVLAISSGTFIGSASAHGNGGNFSDLVAKVAAKFNLNQTEVQAVFDEFKAEKQAEMEEKQIERMDQAVMDGDLTEAQKSAVIAKRAEVKSKLAEIEAMEDEDARREALKSLRTELKTWADEQDIDAHWLMPHGGKGFGPGHGGPRGFRGERPADAAVN